MTIRYGLPLAALVLLFLWWFTSVRVVPTRLSVTGIDDVPLETATLEFFVHDQSGAAASPTEKLGEVQLDRPGAWRVDPEIVPGEALVRISAAGFGRGFCHLQSNGKLVRYRLGPPVAVKGRVLEPDTGGAAGARVQAFGGGPHGVLLGEAVTDAAGKFEIGGLSSTLAYVHVRVFQDGCAVTGKDAWFETDHDLEVQLQLTSPVTGRVVAANGMSVAGTRLLVANVPGVSAEVALNGYFELDHLPPPPTHTRLVLDDLTDEFTHRMTLVAAGDREVELVVRRSGTVEGRVVNAATGEGAGGFAVMHDHGPRGREAVRCDRDGYFVIGRVPPGAVVLSAVGDYRVREQGKWQMVTRSGSREIEMGEAETRRGVAIEIR